MPTPLVTYISRFAPYGDFQKVSNADAIVDSIANRLSIIRGTYVYNPELGTEIHKYVFELNDEETDGSIIGEVERTLEGLQNAEVVDVVTEYSKDMHTCFVGVIVEIERKYVKKITLHVSKDYISILDIEDYTNTENSEV